MATTDEEVAISFSDVELREIIDPEEPLNNTITAAGTIVVEYGSTGAPTLISSSLTTSVGGTFSNYTIAQLGSAYGLAAHGSPPGTGLVFDYSGETPSTCIYLGINVGNTQYSIWPGYANTLTSTIICFAAGTLIRTPQGDVPVETLRLGDIVQASSGAPRPVKWLGHRAFGRDESATPRKHEVVRIVAHAFGEDRPSRDLVVSPGHSICVDLCGEMLIPAMTLVNGATVVRERLDEVVLWHVEFDSHDVLVANNLPAESYLAMGNRGFFVEAGGRLDAFEEGQTRTHADFCRPVAIDGDIPAFVRGRLLDRAKTMGWTPRRDAELRLAVDGVTHDPITQGGAAVFLFPADATDVRLMSNTFEPSFSGANDDRTLGVSLKDLVVSATQGEPRRIDLADARLRVGVYGVEADGASRWRWTNGELVLDPQLWDGLSGTVCLFASYGDDAIRGWIAPARDESEALRIERKPKLYAVG